MKLLPKRNQDRGFSLAEVLIVTVIILGLSALVAPSAKVIGNVDMQRGVGLIHRNLSLARQTAIRENRPIEVRFYYYADPIYPDGGKQFRSLQYLYEADPTDRDSAAIAKSKIIHLPANIIVMNDPQYSTLVTAPELQGTQPDDNKSESLTGTYYSFTFMSDGSTNLQDDTPGAWFLTVVEEADLASSETLPSHFVTLQIDPFSGALRRLQPEAG